MAGAVARDPDTSLPLTTSAAWPIILPREDDATMKFALIAPVRNWAAPFSLLYIGTALRAQGHEVAIFEGFGWLHEDPGQAAIGRELDRIAEYRPDIIGIGCYSYERDRVLAILKALSETNLPAKILCGGRHPSFYPETFLDAGADFVCVGEGERLVIDLADRLAAGDDPGGIRGLAFRRDGRNHYDGSVAEHADLDAIERLDYSLTDYQAYVDMRMTIPGRYYRAGSIMTSRSCPAHCIFCADPVFRGGMRYRDLSHVLDDVEYQARQYAIEAFLVEDDVFVTDEDRVVEFCQGLQERRLGLKFACLARARALTDRSVAALKEAGCIQIALGIESGSQRILDYYRKGTTVEQNRTAMQLVNRYGIGICAYTVVNGVNETEEDLQATIDLLKGGQPEIITCNPLTAMPGTVLHEEAVRKGWIDPATAGYNCGAYEPDLCVNVTADELRRRANRVICSVPRSLFATMMSTWSWGERWHVARDTIAFCLRRPRHFAAFVVRLIKGDYRAAVRLFRNGLFAG